MVRRETAIQRIGAFQARNLPEEYLSRFPIKFNTTKTTNGYESAGKTKHLFWGAAFVVSSWTGNTILSKGRTSLWGRHLHDHFCSRTGRTLSDRGYER